MDIESLVAQHHATLLAYAKAELTEGAASNRVGIDRLAFREWFTIWCLMNPDLAMEYGFELYLAN